MAEKLRSLMAVFVNIRDENGRMLLQQRVNTGYRDGYYDYSCSGHVDEGESVLEAAVRELSEELGIDAKAEDLKLVHIMQAFLDIPYTNFTFELDRFEGIPSIREPEKCSDLSYFAPDALPELCTPNLRMNEKSGFSRELTFSKLTPENYQYYMGESYEDYLRK
jgi:8-oxo-dGTP diphosphatase